MVGRGIFSCFVFNVIDIATHDVPEQWVDFSDEYKMGAERYYAYYTEEEYAHD